MWDWRYPINDIKDEVRKARSNGEDSASLDSIEKYLDSLTNMYERLDSEYPENKDEKHFENLIQKQKEIIISSYEHGKQYSNIIMFGGYAGLFALWNFTKGDLAKWQALSVGLSILISLFIYIVFELYGAWLRTTQIKNQMEGLNKAEQLQRFPEEYGKSEMARARMFMKIWPFFFFGAIFFGLLSAILLIYSYVGGLIKIYV